jgi:hypothetical protein
MSATCERCVYLSHILISVDFKSHTWKKHGPLLGNVRMAHVAEPLGFSKTERLGMHALRDIAPVWFQRLQSDVYVQVVGLEMKREIGIWCYLRPMDRSGDSVEAVLHVMQS